MSDIKKHALYKGMSGISVLSCCLLLSLFLLGGCSSGSVSLNEADADTELYDTGTSDTTVSDTELSDTESSETVNSDTNLTDVSPSDAIQPDTEPSDTAAPEESREEEQAKSEPVVDETVSSGLAGKKLSILGDSISTFEGWNQAGCYEFFPTNGTVTDVGQTWWKMVVDDTGMSLCVNGSSSGSTCAGYSLGTDSPQEGCNEFRINGLADAGGSSPDIIIVYMGTNDFIKNIPLGDNDGTRQVEEGNIDNFSDAYTLMLDKLHVHYPNARIFCCNLLPVGGIGMDMSYVQFVNEQGLKSDDYSRRIEMIAASKGYPVIDLANCGITTDNALQYVSDGTHPNPEGMKKIRDAVEAALTN